MARAAIRYSLAARHQAHRWLTGPQAWRPPSPSSISRERPFLSGGLLCWPLAGRVAVMSGASGTATARRGDPAADPLSPSARHLGTESAGPDRCGWRTPPDAHQLHFVSVWLSPWYWHYRSRVVALGRTGVCARRQVSTRFFPLDCRCVAGHPVLLCLLECASPPRRQLQPPAPCSL
jgi:hypothetical protein